VDTRFLLALTYVQLLCVLTLIAAESAAALAKARKKLLKIQGIASQADKAHSSVIVDAGVLAGESAAADEEPSAAEGRNQGNSSSSSAAAGRNGEAAGSQDRRSSKQGAAGGSATAGELCCLCTANAK
jgi:hypothetical protein